MATTSTFIRQPGRSGPFGALLDEYARAAADFCHVVERLDLDRFDTERPSDNPNTVSPRAICLHVIGAAHRYAHYIRKARGVDFVERYEAEAERTGRLAATARHVPDRGWFATPAVAADLPPASPVLHEEIFGPLLAVERVRNVEAACDALDRSPFALTAGLFARNPDTVEYVEARVPVGNLYVNRSITGAMVARQPFGGNRLSGTGTKAGGPGYLLQFVEPRVVTENTMRHGLVV